MAFLDGMANALTSAAITTATGGFKDRPSNRDNDFMQDLADKNLPREAGRHNAFLDQTYGEDTRRLLERIKTIGDQTRMSPWELAGVPAATPMSVDTAAGKSTDNFMKTLGPMTSAASTAKLQAMTQLQTAQIAADAQRDVANIQTGGGQGPIEQIKLTQSQRQQVEQLTRTNLEDELLKSSQREAVRQETFLNTVRTMAELLPKTSYNFGFMKKESIENFQQLIQTIGKGRLTVEEEKKLIQDFGDSLPADEWASFAKDGEQFFQMLQDQIRQAAENFGQGLQKGFLGNVR